MARPRAHVIQPPPEQGEFFPITVHPNGLTDQQQHQPVYKIGEVVPDGFFAADPTQTAAGNIALQTLVEDVSHAAEVSRHRRAGQLGKHSPLRHTGSYLDYRIGDVLSDGRRRLIVTERNYDTVARDFARQLENRRLEQLACSPRLGEERRPDTVIKGLIAAFDIDRVLFDGKPADKVPEDVMSSRERMMAARDATVAGFLPKTNGEKNLAHYLADKVEIRGGVHTYLMLIHAKATSNYRKNHGHKNAEASGGDVAYISVLHEMGDYFAQSIEEGKAYVALGEKIDEAITPHLVIGDEEFKQHRYALIALIRDYDLENYRDYAQTTPFTLMTDREDRRPHDDFPEKRKTVLDPYMASQVDVGDSMTVRAYIQKRLGEINVADLRKSKDKLIADQRNRARFWERAIRGVETSKYQVVANRILENQGRRPISRVQ